MTDKLSSMRKAGRLASRIFDEIATLIKPGVNALAVEQLIDERINEAGMEAAFRHHQGYPAASCISVNDAVVHSIPQDYTFTSGDIVSVDFGLRHNGWIVDSARTYLVGNAPTELRRLCEVSKNALSEAIKLCHVDAPINRIGERIEQVVSSANFYVVKELSGHGVGQSLWEPPTIYNYAIQRNLGKLEAGMAIAIEPIIALRPVKLITDSDGWTMKTVPATATAHFEDTVYISREGPLVLTE